MFSLHEDLPGTGLHPKAPKSLNSHENGTKTSEVLAAGLVFKGCHWNLMKIQPRFTACLDSAASESSPGERSRWGCHRGLCALPENLRGTGLCFYSPTSWLEFCLCPHPGSMPQSRALPTGLHCASTLHASFPLFPQCSER